MPVKSATSGRTHLGPSHNTINSTLRLHHTIGNQAVQRPLEENTRDVRGDITRLESAGFGWDFSGIPVFAPDRQGRSQTACPCIQPKFVSGQVDDSLEREADRIADRMLSLKDSSPSIPAVPAPVSHRKVTNQGKEAKTLPALQSGPKGVDSGFPSEIWSLKGGGVALPQPRRTYFESKFGYDFTKVRIRSGSRAAALARAVNARAFSFGQDIVFGAGQYSPETGEGTRLLAHELVHVVQQQTSPPFLQRQREPGYFDPGGVEEQLEILLEGEGLPLKLYQQPNIRQLSFSEIRRLSFRRKLGAIIKLGDFRHKNAVKTLIRIAENKLYVSPNGFTAHQKLMLQEQALIALGKIGTPEAIKKLTDLLSSKDPKERSQATHGFSAASGTAMPYWQVVPATQLATTLLTQLNKEKDAGVKSQIIFALGNVGSRLSGNKEKQLVVTELIREMENHTGMLKSAAINALGKIRDKRATEPLLQQLKLWSSIDSLVRDIIFALGEIGDVRAVEYLVIFLEKHGSISVRSQAATALGKIRGKKAIEALIRRRDQETDATVKAAISKAIHGPIGVIHQEFK
jgi:HEAT repeat protein